MDIKSRKVVIIGAGHVGSHVGFSLATQGICDEIVFIDTDENKAIAQAEDLFDATVYLPHHVEVKAGNYADVDDAEILVISVGPLPTVGTGETRMDTMGKTLDCLQSVVAGIKNSKFGGIIISISNPADVIAHYVQHETGISPERVISTSTTLDSARLRKVLAKELKIDQKSIYACVMGEHGESQMVPWSCATIYGKSLMELMKEEPETYGKLDLPKLAGDARFGGWLVLNGKGSTEFGIGTSCAELVKTIFANERKVCMISTLLNGEYGIKGVYASVPAILGKDGVIRVIELPLNKEELAEFAKSCQTMDENYQKAISK